jgi:glycine cleavage system aminomethyltransferase T/glycine/D-amino acid oxidase-like deaminating enzyme
MSQFPKNAKLVIIGAGIVGNCVAGHLAEKGWKDMVLIDKGPLPNPGGSTGHASNFIFPVDHGKAFAQITLDSMKQYEKLGVQRTCGGIELARTETSMAELRRRMASTKNWGIESELLDPDGVLKLFPWINKDKILGGFYTPSVSVVDSLRAGTIMREKAQDMGALSVFANTEVLDLEVEDGRIKGVKTTRGDVEAEYVIICCGVWSPRIAEMAGAAVPLAPVVHQMIDAGPIPQLAHVKGEIKYPIIRDMSVKMYERQSASNMEVGSYAHRSILIDPNDIPSNEQAKLSPTELPFTNEDFEPQLADALDLMPELLDNDKVEIQYAINGLISLTPDGNPVIGETPEVKGLWVAAAIWIKEGPGSARLLAEWMTDGVPEIDPSHVDIARFYPYARTKKHVWARAIEGFPKLYDIVHPMEQYQSSRNNRLSPFHARTKELGAVYFETAGWERPYWYESNKGLLEEYADKISPRTNEWDARWWSPIITAENLALRERVAMTDLSAFAIFDIVGKGALETVQKIAVSQMDNKVGKASYTLLLNEKGGIRSDLVIARMGKDSFRVITGGGHGGVDKKWFIDNLPADGSAQLHDQTSALCTVGVWGPSARALLESVTEDDISNAAFPYATVKEFRIQNIPVWALRMSYVGEYGWEIYTAAEHGQMLWDILWEAGQKHRVVPVGIGVYGTTARLEKGFRLFGNELDTEYNPVEAGLALPKVKAQDFIGKAAYLKVREEDPITLLCTLTVDDHTDSKGEKRYMIGNFPVLTQDGKIIVDAKNRPAYVASAGYGPCVGKYILLAYLPPEYAKVGKKLKVEYFCEQFPVTVEVVGSAPLFDPQNDRLKG